MPIQTWEGLQKSATDSRSIADYIDDQIAIHNGDPTAHTGAGESLDLHKNSTVIDHLEGSIVGDKFSKDQIQFRDDFTGDIAQYSPTGSVNNSDRVLAVESFHHPSFASDATIKMTYFQLASFPASDCTIDWVGAFYSTNNSLNPHINIGDSYPGGSSSFGMRLTGGHLQGYVWDGTTLQTVNITYTLAEVHFWRIHIDTTDGKAHFFDNGVDVAQITLGSFTLPDLSNGVYLFADSGSTTTSFVTMGSLRASYPIDLL